MTNARPVGPGAAAFPPASPLHGQVESLARELHDVRARLLALDAATGQSAPPLRAPPLQIARPAYAPPAAAAGTPPPADAAWWPAPHGHGPSMAPAPGARCAGLAQRGVPVQAISCCGLSEGETAEVLERIVAEQVQTRSFVALFLTDDSRCLPLFRYQGLDVELVPSPQDLAACPGALSPDALMVRRMQSIRATWGVTGYRDLGTRPLPWPAADLAPDAGDDDSAAAAARPVVVFDRDYRRHNPYQHLLHVAMPGLSFRPGPIDRALGMLAAGRPTAFHLNWEEALYRSAADAGEAGAIIDTFLAQLDALAAGGGRLIWTLHNEAPHEDRFPDLYRHLAQGVARRSDLVIVHSLRAADLAADLYGVPRDRLCVVPHGSYHDLYSADLSPAAARTSLGLPEDGVLFGFVGAVRPYKNVPLLVDGFRHLTQAQPTAPLRLMVAGRQMTPLDIAPDDPMRDRLVLRDGAIPEEALAAHVRACDAIVLPFERILTSGSLVLAMSLGVPVIAPDLPSLGELLDDGVNGLVFPAGDAEALAARMADFVALGADDRARLARNAATTARLNDWAWIGRRVARRVHGLFAPDAEGQVAKAILPDAPVPDMADPAFARRA
jgi:glycosyltransferase involved in cell wall biosynthesis